MLTLRPLAAVAALGTLVPTAPASDGIGNVALHAASSSPQPGTPVLLSVTSAAAGPYLFLLGRAGADLLSGVGPIDVDLGQPYSLEGGLLPANGDQGWAIETPAMAGLVGEDFVCQFVCAGRPTPTGFAVSNPVRVEFAPDAPLAFTDSVVAIPPLPLVSSMRPAVADVDGDGDLDAYLPTISTNLFDCAAQNRLLLNDGTGSFADATDTHLPVLADASRSAVFADFDGDFDLDLAVGNSFGDFLSQAPTQSFLYENAGDGHFTLVGNLPGGPDFVAALAAGDVDGDGDVDLVLGCNGNGFGAPEKLLLNDGSGGFTLAAPGFDSSDATSRIHLADVDADGDPDVVAANFDAGGARVHLNDGTGLFAPLPGAFPVATTAWATDLGLGDFDADGDLDAMVVELPPGSTTPRYVRAFANNGLGAFTLVQNGVTGIPTTDNVLDVAIGDVDGDGDADAIVASGTGAADWILLNDGTGHFAPVPGGIEIVTATRTPLLVDLDGNNALDLLYSAGAQAGTAHALFR